MLRDANISTIHRVNLLTRHSQNTTKSTFQVCEDLLYYFSWTCSSAHKNFFPPSLVSFPTIALPTRPPIIIYLVKFMVKIEFCGPFWNDWSCFIPRYFEISSFALNNFSFQIFFPSSLSYLYLNNLIKSHLYICLMSDFQLNLTLLNFLPPCSQLSHKWARVCITLDLGWNGANNCQLQQKVCCLMGVLVIFQLSERQSWAGWLNFVRARFGSYWNGHPR